MKTSIVQSITKIWLFTNKRFNKYMSTRRMYTLTLCCQVRSVRQSGCFPTMHRRCPSLAPEQWSTTQSIKVWRNSVRHREWAWASWPRYIHPTFTYYYPTILYSQEPRRHTRQTVVIRPAHCRRMQSVLFPHPSSTTRSRVTDWWRRNNSCMQYY